MSFVFLLEVKILSVDGIISSCKTQIRKMFILGCFKILK